MAQWTNSSGHFLRPYRSPFGSPQIRYFQESTAAASTATIRVGDVVRRSTVTTTGGFRIRRDPSTAGNGANLMHLGGAEVIGIAVTGSTSDGSTTGLIDDSSGANTYPAEGKKIGVAVADGLTEYLGYFYQGDTAARAVSSLIGLTRPLQYDSSRNTYFIASTNSTVALVNVRIMDFPQDVLGSCGGVPCVFKFLSSLVHPAVNLANQVA